MARIKLLPPIKTVKIGSKVKVYDVPQDQDTPPQTRQYERQPKTTVTAVSYEVRCYSWEEYQRLKHVGREL